MKDSPKVELNEEQKKFLKLANEKVVHLELGCLLEGGEENKKE